MMENAFLEMFGSSIRVDLKYNSLEKWREERAQNPRPRPFEVDFQKIAAARVPYSTYHSLLDEHWRSKSYPEKNPQPDPDPIPF